MTAARCAVVVPTLGRPSLGRLLASLAEATGPLPGHLVLVDDRRSPGPLPVPPPALAARTTVVRSGGRGPAAARNAGWRAVAAGADRPEWVAFLDDDVVAQPSWPADLAVDLEQPPDVGGVQGRVVVPLPADRRPTDWERGTAGLARARWITADMAYRLRVLEETGGFDERFPRAYREDADLALRVAARGHRLVHGRRQVSHPVRPAGRWVSVRAQAGNADDALMHRLHGPRWRELAGAPAGGRRRHLVVTGAAALALAGLATGRRRAAAAAAVGWAAGTGRFAWARIGPGPRTVDEVATMLLTSVAIPPAATWHWLRGRWRHRAVRPGAAAVLFDRDGTLIRDVPYNGDPDLVVPMPGAVAAVRALRARGVRLGVITNQSGIARGRLSTAQVEDVNRRVEQIFGPFDVWQLCPHGPGDGCGCRKPAPGMVLAAAAHLGVAPADVVVIGDIGADVDAARAAGARAVLVPTPATRRDEVRRAPVVAADLAHAVQLAVGTVP